MKKEITNTPHPLNNLREFTNARIAIGRTGTSIPLKKMLEFKLAHAHARDAVYAELDTDSLLNTLKQFDLPILQLHSKAENRQQYLQRPDLGRQLNEEAITLLKDNYAKADIVVVIADGLSATAVNDNASGLLQSLLPKLQLAKLTLAPICLVEQGRVAIGDELAAILNAKLSLVFIGERPGLSATDSMSVYITYNPKPGLTDNSRNCISNIRQQGLRYKPAAEKLFYLVQECFKRKLSGVNLKDNAGLLS